MGSKLTAAVFLSTLLMLFPVLTTRAHEVNPSVGDFTAENGHFRIDLRLNLEAFVAGVDLDGLSNTNESEQSGDYDSLRALPPEALEDRLRQVWPDIAGGIRLRAGGQLVPLSLQAVRIDEIGDVDLPRSSFLTLVAELPAASDSIRFGWDKRFGTLVLRQNGVKEGYTGYLTGGQDSPEIAVKGGDHQSGWQTFAAYIPVGFEHILPLGLDHILFVLGLFFLSTHLRPLLWQVTAFTLAHTVTLALGAMGWVSVPSAIVEPLIAASITYVAVENVFTSGLSKWRPMVIFGFGLLHGLGFASVLGEFGIPDDQFFPALIAFNVGVELGQLTVISIAFLLVGSWFRKKPWYRQRIAIPASLLIAVIGAYWFVDRVFT
ncbi:MAG TPA: HupE/UreJ family protein [Rhodobacteraceae bacterium]|nr:HupE/UreJ family protein [Paracoccaceae bacterium]